MMRIKDEEQDIVKDEDEDEDEDMFASMPKLKSKYDNKLRE